MKTTITINLGGLVFHIDDDAYEMLHTYLIAVEKQFVSDEDRKEIMADVEARLSELFTEVLEGKRDVIMKGDVAKVIKIMGEPEDFVVEEPESTQSRSNRGEDRGKRARHKTSKRLYRDPENRVLGGVCGGLGAYFSIDPIVFRIIFILFALSMAGVIIYIILWMVMPEAFSTAQKLEMRGEPITIENIKKAVRDEFENVKRSMKYKKRNH